jgi:pimeloyl-ACP methyl ester carboxylesterase
MDGRDRDAAPHVVVGGQGPRTLWLNGSMSDSTRTWARQSELANRWTMVMVTRLGMPGPPVRGDDFDEDARALAELLRAAPAHVVAHSSGCLGALLATGHGPGGYCR